MSSQLTTSGYTKMAASRTNSDSTNHQHIGQDDLTVSIKSGKVFIISIKSWQSLQQFIGKRIEKVLDYYKE